VLIIDNLETDHLGRGGQTALGELLGETHQFVEMDLRGRNKRP
jgi:hypothetical protein